MLDSKRLVPLHDLAERREDGAARALAEARRVLAQRESQLSELENYREPPTSAAGATSAELLRNREAFRLRLAEAIRLQRTAVEQARAQVEVQRRAWNLSHHETQKVEQLRDRAQHVERARQDQRSQRELDELALRCMATRRFG